jgi:hypothetical protein
MTTKAKGTSVRQKITDLATKLSFQGRLCWFASLQFRKVHD